jgi:predicted dehydrogenase
MPGIEIVAACDVSAEAVAAVAALADTATYTTDDYRALLRETQVDLVSVCTSNDMHHPVVMEAIAQGVDVFCEKPLALTYAQAQEMYAAAQERGVKTGVNFSHRRTPAAQLAREIIASGALGQIHHVSAIYAAGWPQYAQRPGSWRNQREKAGFGGLGDMGSHMLDMVLWWLGAEVEGVASNLRTFVPERLHAATGQPMQVTTEDEGMVLLDYANGALGYLCGSYTFTGRGYDQRAEIYGSEGGLMYDQQHPYQLQVWLPEEALAQYTVLEAGGAYDHPYTTILVPERLQGRLPGEPQRRRTILMDFVEAYQSDEPFAFAPGFREGLRVQEVLEGIARANAARCWISLPL